MDKGSSLLIRTFRPLPYVSQVLSLFVTGALAVIVLSESDSISSEVEVEVVFGDSRPVFSGWVCGSGLALG